TIPVMPIAKARVAASIFVVPSPVSPVAPRVLILQIVVVVTGTSLDIARARDPSPGLSESPPVVETRVTVTDRDVLVAAAVLVCEIETIRARHVGNFQVHPNRWSEESMIAGRKSQCRR